ncbi:MAG: hypothetical protein OEY22_05270 [Candidatus Bathyarchaeota archaeon]|nr:hypothetical protein [Candidatus Bathyarchaeota archaeon]MDH5788658.1 hypothetical protein [Candidatus Bathyarchaeota archaeon]
MKTTELSPDEERHLLNLSVIPALIVTYILLAAFVYFGRNQSSLSPLHILIYFGIPFAIAMPTTIFLSFEVLYSRKARQPINRGARRLLGRISLTLLAISLLGAILSITYFALAPWFDENNLLLLTGVLWFAIWIFLMFHFKEAFNKLSSGKW